MTHYDTLGLSATATPPEIDEQYRAIAKLVHPDVGGDAITFSVLREAYEVLSDSTSRAAYDRTLVSQPSRTTSSGTPATLPPTTDGWLEPSTAAQRAQAAKLAAMGITSWHQTSDQYFKSMRVRFRRAGTSIVAAFLAVVVWKLIGAWRG